MFAWHVYFIVFQTCLKKKIYDECLAVFLDVCSNRFYTIKRTYCQSLKMMFLSAQHSSLPSLETTFQFSPESARHLQPSVIHVGHMV